MLCFWCSWKWFLFLQLAVNSVMHDASPTDIGPARMATSTMGHSSESDIPVDELHSPTSMDDDASASGPSASGSFGGGVRTNFTPPRMIHFNVEYRTNNIPIVLPDSETVGKLFGTLCGRLTWWIFFIYLCMSCSSKMRRGYALYIGSWSVWTMKLSVFQWSQDVILSLSGDNPTRTKNKTKPPLNFLFYWVIIK